MYTIILAGGFGTRLFPLSRSSFPKQFIPLLDDKSLFQKAVYRALKVSRPEEIYIVTNKNHKFLVENQLFDIEATQANVILEPCGKNTLPAILNAVLKIYQSDKKAKILVLSSDQLIDESDAYRNAIADAEALADEYIITFGIIPTCPHTGYGYIQKGEELAHNGFKVSAFKEKPDLHTAVKYLQAGYLWNAGIFCFSAKVFLDEVKKYASDVFNAFNSNDDEKAYELTPKISIDYGVLEKTDKVAVVPMKASWNDLGSFEALYSVQDKDVCGNVVDGDYISPDGKNNLIISDTKKLVSTIGLSDMAIVDTADVLMVCPRSLSQSIGKITDELAAKGDERVSLHTTVHRPWGLYTTLLRADNFLIKRLVVHPHKRLSLQYHNHRSEHWVVVKGEAEVVNGEKVLMVKAGESTFIPIGCRHRLSNPGDEALEVVEVQCGNVLTEDDIVRVDDDFKRE